MYNHAPEGYACPFCLLVQRVEGDSVERIVYQDAAITAFISSHKWTNNPGHVLIIPNEHYENIYDLPVHLGGRIHECARAIALALKAAYGCDGISTRQHNEPAGNQDVWHYHLHLFPRYAGDGLYGSQKELLPEKERAAYAQKLELELKDWKPATIATS
jgi:histidine triad (HIT) family protein